MPLPTAVSTPGDAVLALIGNTPLVQITRLDIICQEIDRISSGLLAALN
jgi:hypothetical protein